MSEEIDHAAEFVALTTGIRSACLTPIEQAVAFRFSRIVGGLQRKQGEYVYDCNRCCATQLGWRFLQMFGPFRNPAVDDIKAGRYDEQIEATWHEAASSQHWYQFEKDWGWGE